MPTEKTQTPYNSLKNKDRRPGRPRGGAINVEQREHLLDIALMLFAEQGIAETSLNAIARKAEVSAAMLTYYFQSRESLLDIIIEERFLPLRHDIAAIFDQHIDDPHTALMLILKKIVETAEQHVWFAPLWMQEMATGESAFRQRLKLKHGDAVRQKAVTIIQKWQQDGKLNARLEPNLLMSSLMSLILVPFAQFRKTKSPAGFNSDQILQHVTALISKGFLNNEGRR